MNEIYVDHAATTRMKREVLESMMPFLNEKYGNASSLYPLGRENRIAIEEARTKVQRAINARIPEEIVFTSGGSEADNLAIKGVMHANRRKGKHLITSKIEHKAVLNACKTLEKEGYEVSYIDVDATGMIDLKALENSIKEDTVMISVMMVNNEVGTIEPIQQIAEIAEKYHLLFHTDAVQAVGSVPIDVQQLKVDLLSMSAHKFYGPKGVGALFVKEGVLLEPQICGGHQENELRAGTENVAGIVGIGTAIEMATKEQEKYAQKLKILRDTFFREVRNHIPKCYLNGHPEKRHPGNANFSFEGVDGRVLSLLLAEKGIDCSSGSACSSKEKNPSHVLKALGFDDERANGSIRFSFGEENSMEDVFYITSVLKETINRIKIR